MRPLFFLWLLLLASPALAEELIPEATIAAIVNDEVISLRDLNQRMTLVLATTNLSDTPETRAGIAPQLLRELINEKLESQEATRNGVTVSEDDIAEALSHLEQQRNMPPGSLAAELERRGVPKEALNAQARAQLSWNKLIAKKIRPTVRISDEEINRERSKRQVTGSGDREVQIAILPLPIDKPENELQVKTLAEKLVSEMKGGAPFASVAQQLSGASASPVEPFWISQSQLDPKLAAALADVQPGGVTTPVRTLEGYVIAQLVNQRGIVAEGTPLTEVVLKDILLALPSNAGQAEVDMALLIGKEISKHPGTCTDPTVAGMTNLEDFNIQVRFLRDRLDSFPDALRNIIQQLKLSQASEPYASNDGIRVFVLCEKVEKPAAPADREETAQRLYRRKMELEAEKYLRRLRREATIDVRLGANS